MRSRRWIALLAGFALLFVAHAAPPVGAQPAQKVHRADFQPASDEVFSVVTAFYDFDSPLALDPRVVETWAAAGRIARGRGRFGDRQPACQVSARIEQHTTDQLVDQLGMETELKEKRILDNRPKA